MTSIANDNTVAPKCNYRQEEITAFLLAAAERMTPTPVPYRLWFSAPGRPVQDEPLDRLAQFALGSRTSEEILGILAELRRRIDLMKGEMK